MYGTIINRDQCMDPSTIVELIFSVSAEITALLMVIFIYSLDRFETFRKSDVLNRPYRRLLKLVAASIVAGAFTTAFSFVSLTDSNAQWFPYTFYATLITFWSSLLLLLIACIQIVKEALE